MGWRSARKQKGELLGRWVFFLRDVAELASFFKRELGRRGRWVRCEAMRLGDDSGTLFQYDGGRSLSPTVNGLSVLLRRYEMTIITMCKMK